MKKVLYDTPKTKKYLDSLTKIYMIGVWIGCGVREHYFTGKCDKDGMPLVYDYYDGNGACSEWHLMRLDNTTTGGVFAWSTDCKKCQALANAYDKEIRKNLKR